MSNIKGRRYERIDYDYLDFPTKVVERQMAEIGDAFRKVMAKHKWKPDGYSVIKNYHRNTNWRTNMTEPKIPLSRIELPRDRKTLHGTMLVKQLVPDDKTEGGIILPDTAQTDRALFSVEKVSEDANWAKAGDHVVLSKYVKNETCEVELGEGYSTCNVNEIKMKVLPESWPNGVNGEIAEIEKDVEGETDGDATDTAQE